MVEMGYQNPSCFSQAPRINDSLKSLSFVSFLSIIHGSIHLIIIIPIKLLLQYGQHWNHNGSSDHGQRARNRSCSSGIRSRCWGRRRQLFGGSHGKEKGCNESNEEEVDGEWLRCHDLKKCREKENMKETSVEGVMRFLFLFVDEKEKRVWYYLYVQMMVIEAKIRLLLFSHIQIFPLDTLIFCAVKSMFQLF